MGKKYDFDYIILGSGPAGSAAAFGLAKAKKRVALVESRFFGGSNLNTRDIPYAVALNFSHQYARYTSYPELGHQDLTFSLPTAIAHQRKAILDSGGNSKKPFEAAGITCFNGRANFLDPHTIAINHKKFTARSFILATGSRLKTTGITGIDTVPHLTPETAIKVRRLPKVALVIGGGATGCEIAEYYAELGTKVVLIESASRLLPREDKEVGDTIADYFTHRLGMMVLLSSQVVALEKSAAATRVIFKSGRSEKSISADCVILATGSTPALDYGLENAKVKYKDTGITVNKYFETSAKHIYAIGDCIGGESSTERADYEGNVLVSNLLGKAKSIVSYQGFIRTVSTYPEVATIGLNEEDLIQKKRKYKKSLIKLTTLPISKVHDLEYGFVKLLTDKSNRILGAVIVAPSASLIATEVAIAIRHQLTTLELASTPHIVNNFSYALKLAAKAILAKKR